MVGVTDVGSQYSPMCGVIFIFNLIVGTGALAMPLGFYKAGWLISIIVLVVLGIMSYISATFMVEAMATANMTLRYKRKNTVQSIYDDELANSAEDEKATLIPSSAQGNEDVFDISERVEMASMASLFFNKYGVIAFYISIIVYLYGDLAIYCVAIPKSLRDAMCTYKSDNLTDDMPCWPDIDISRMNAYRIAVAVMSLLLSPFVFTNVQKSKYLQLVTTIMRWLGFLLMIILALIRVGSGKGTGKPEVVSVAGIPNLFGVCVYAFMCHHSLPSIITPISRKKHLSTILAIDYVSILIFYSLISFTAIFASDHLKDLYTLNFLPPTSVNVTSSHEAITNIAVFQYFLALFPVFTLGSNFPIVGITLRNNLKILFSKETRPYPWLVENLVFPLATLIPPFIVAMVTTSVDLLVGITGSYAGSVIQYIIPAMLVYCSRKEAIRIMGIFVQNKHRSICRHVAWVWIIVVWCVICVVLVTVNHIITKH